MKNTYFTLINLLSTTYTTNQAAYLEAKQTVEHFTKTNALTGNQYFLNLQIDDLINTTQIFEDIPVEIKKDAKNWYNWCQKNGFKNHSQKLKNAFHF